jgi:hypothetical protein
MDVEEVGSRDPAILACFLPRSAILPHAESDVQAVVAEIETLAVTLRAVADESEGVIFEVVLRLLV